MAQEMESNQGATSLSEEARQLVAANQRGVLGTLLPKDGYPYASMVEYAPLPNGDVILFLSQLAEHQKYLTADSRVSLLIAPDIMAENALAQPRVSLVGRAELAEDRQAMAEIYLQYHPGARQYINFGDFQFYRLRVEKVRYIAGFGRMGWIPDGRYHKD
ncbi:MAG: pyridoxamine 5'-phosphate oxidase family protein [Ardenticatenaceae bacterium]|nr:pyridoxamine 5'-phosphate oxidase family protein [Ardenticatenaceae bacterium]MCB9446314.1 pyridoxamine 5'-phosphate oxidase family protein [Ardenticatenaceae bacterium]